MCVILQQCFRGKDKDLLPGKTLLPLCYSRAVSCRLLEHSRLSTPDPGHGQTLLQSPGHHWHLLLLHGCNQVGAGQLCSSGQTQLSTDLHVLSRTGTMMGPLLITAQHPAGSQRCHWGEHLPALCVCFHLNLSVTLAHRVKIEGTSRLLWCTQDPVGCSPPLWEDGSNVHTAGTPQSQCLSNLCRATLLFQHTLGSRKPAGFPERSVNWKAHYFEHSFWHCLLKTQLPNERNVRVTRTALRTLESAAISGNRHSSCTSGQEHTRSCETVNLFSVQRETPNNHIKKPHLLIPGGPSKCLSGFLKVLGSEGPTWVSSALSLPMCDWRNGWAEPLCHWIMDLSFYSCISGWPVGPPSRGVFWLQPHTATLLELLGAA